MRPLQLQNRYGIIIGFLILAIGLTTTIDKVSKFLLKIFSDDSLLSWKFFAFATIFLCFIVWFVMNHFWSKEYRNHQVTKFELNNYRERLKTEENERLVDIVTGVPNMKSLELDLDEFFSERRKKKQIQFILIDLRNFRKINRNYGFMKTNKVLRMIAQEIYTTMRRNEDMYKYPMVLKSRKSFLDKFYRIHTGGDEFAFIIEGDQSDAIGFTNRLVPRFTNEFSSRTIEILGKKEKLSFYSSIVQVNHRDEYPDIIERAQNCYNLAKESDCDFSISWYPHDLEQKISDSDWKKKNYDIARERFHVVLND